MKDKGLFIVFEGVDGSGKSTQAAKLAKFLEDSTGRKVIKTAEPYNLRELILGRKDLSKMSELLLFLADRAEHVEKIIKPNLEAGNFVICERYEDSTRAYQTGGHGVDSFIVEHLINDCCFPLPDVKILLDLSPEIAFERVKARNNQNDKFEAEGLELIKKVSDYYRNFLAGFIRIPCDNLNEDEVFQRIVTGLFLSVGTGYSNGRYSS